MTIGQEVYVRLPYDGGAGWARVVYFTPPEIEIEFLPGEAQSVLYTRRRLVRPARIVAARPKHIG